MQVYRGTKNLSPLKLSDFYQGDGQFGKGMYFGNEESQPRILSTTFNKDGFALFGVFLLTLNKDKVIRHKKTNSQSHLLASCEVEISEYEVIVKNPLVPIKLIRFEVGFLDLKNAQEFSKVFPRTSVVEKWHSYWIEEFSPDEAEIVHKALVEKGYKVI